MGIVFNKTTPVAQLPNNNVIAQTLVEAANDSNNNFNVTFNPSTVQVLGKLT